MLFHETESVKQLKHHYDTVTSKTHLRDLLQDTERNALLRLRHEPAIADFTHCKIDKTGFGLLLKVAEELKVF